MPKKLLPMIGALIGLYLIVVYSKGTAATISAGASGATNVITALQGRSRPA